MAPENLNPIDELKRLDQQVESVADLAGLKPIFFRLDEIAKQNANDFEVQLAVGDIKQHLVNRGAKLKAIKESGQLVPPAPTSVTAVPPPPVTAAPPPVTPPPAPQPAPPPRPAAAPPPINIPPKPAAPLPQVPAATSQPPAQTMGQPAAEMLPATQNMPVSPPPPPPRPPQPPPQAPVPPPVAAPGPPNVQASAPPPPIQTPRPPQPPAQPPNASVTQNLAPPPPPKSPVEWKRALWVGGLVGVLIAVGIAVLVNVARKGKNSGPGGAKIQMQIATTPAGAAVTITGDAASNCTSNCQIALAPGDYQITAFLDGYEAAARGITVGSGQPNTVNLALEPQAQSLRILTDLDSGKVTLDDQPPVDLQESQYIFDRVDPGTHTVKLTGKTGEASFTFTVAAAQAPAITSPVTVKNLNAVVVSSLGNQAHVVTNSGPVKLAVNGQPELDAGPAGVDLKNFQKGVDEIVLGDGKDQRSVKETFGPAPMLTAFFKSDLNVGTLIVSTGEDGVHVFVNSREWPRTTKRGQVRIQTIGKQVVHVTKDGYDGGPPQTADIKKGVETRLEFAMRALPQFSSLQVTGAMPGVEILIDQRSAGSVGADGSFSAGSITPGDHTVELRRDQYMPKRFTKTFRAGATVTISGADAVLAAERVAPPPEKKVEVTSAPKEKPAPPPVKTGTMADWEDNSLWHQENGAYVHQGAGLIFYKMPPRGTFTFTVQLLKGGGFLRGGKVRWVLNYVDGKNYSYFELDNKNFTPRVVVNGKTTERDKTPLKDLEKQKSFTVQIDVTPEHIVHKLFAGGQWLNLDVWAEPGRNFSEGKFGFQVQGNDEIGITDFKFQPK